MLVELSPLAGLAPVTIGTVTLAEVALGPVTSVAPYRGQEGEVGKRLESAFGFGFPAPDRLENGNSARAMWVGRGRALVIGAALPEGLAAFAALTDQSDAQAAIMVTGEEAAAVLARLTPLDLRERSFPVGATARSLIGHMTAQVSRTAADSYEIMVMRSMGATALHELTEAAQGVAAR